MGQSLILIEEEVNVHRQLLRHPLQNTLLTK